MEAKHIIALFIPILAILIGGGLAMLGLWLDYRKKRDIFQLHHSERMAAIEKGIDVPALPPDFFADYRRRPHSPAGYLRSGLMWLLIGVAVTFALYETELFDHSWSWGLVLMAVGVANLLFYTITRRSETPRP